LNATSAPQGVVIASDFTTYAMTSKYAIALYELVCLRINLQTCIEVFPIERFRELLGVPPNAYADGQDFRRKVIDPAVVEVNRLSDLHVDIELRRRHARAAIHEVAVAWRRQVGDEFRASMQERERSKVGRRERLRGASRDGESKTVNDSRRAQR
jgi:hypothetical protein